jgi:hypothetical protein
MRSYTICLFIILFVCFKSNGQTVNQIASSQKPYATNHSSMKFAANSAGSADTIHLIGHQTAPFAFMSANYYTNSLGFFCKKEIEMEKALKFPVKFRLGSVAYTDKMEGKGAGMLPISIQK